MGESKAVMNIDRQCYPQTELQQHYGWSSVSRKPNCSQRRIFGLYLYRFPQTKLQSTSTIKVEKSSRKGIEFALVEKLALKNGHVQHPSSAMRDGTTSHRFHAILLLEPEFVVEELAQPWVVRIILLQNRNHHDHLVDQTAAVGLMDWVIIGIDPGASILESIGSGHAMKELIECIAANALTCVVRVNVKLDGDSTTRTSSGRAAEGIIEAFCESESEGRLDLRQDNLG
jgi:hypothetical protein